jgi:protein O-mannosyl-transferase
VLTASLSPKAKNTILKWAPWLVLLLTFALYVKASFWGLTNFDDDIFIANNPLIKDCSFSGIVKMFTGISSGKYQPFTTLSFAAEYAVTGLNPFVFHLTNILLHLASTWLVFKITEQLSGNRTTAAIVSLLFGIHPMHVEEVAWASERKDMMYAYFYLLSMWYYIKYCTGGYKSGAYIGSFCFFIVSLFSKSEATTLPLALLLIDIYYKRKINWKTIAEKIPMLAFSIFISTVSFLSQQSDGSIGQMTTLSYGIVNRLFLITSVPAFYLVRLFIPGPLSAMHYYPELSHGLLPWPYYASLPILATAIWLLAKLKSLGRELFFGIGFFAITISVMPQLVFVGPSLTPERYSYVPYIGLLLILASWITKVAIPKWKTTTTAALSLFVAALCVITWLRIDMWQSSITLLTDTINKNSYVSDRCYFFWLRGNAYISDGDVRAAIDDYDEAIKEHPGYIEAYANKGAALFNAQDMKDAITSYDTALRLSPNHAMYYYNRGAAKASINDLAGALSDYNKFLSYRPDYSAAYTDRGMVRMGLRDSAGACHDWTEANRMGDVHAPGLLQQYCH